MRCFILDVWFIHICSVCMYVVFTNVDVQINTCKIYNYER